jgi:hypothetical protein
MTAVRASGLLLALLVIVGARPQASAAGDAIVSEGLGLPLACAIGKTCWVANYLDLDATEKVRDFRCRGRSYNGHDGVDFAIRDLAVMATGVPVLATAPGNVHNARDGMPDVAVSDEASRKRIAGRECGNGVIVDHEGSWQTQYCHLRQGSVRVKAGQKVQRGSPLGFVGLSGLTEFPHLHLTVRHNKSVVDPFTGLPMSAGCQVQAKPLWARDESIPYEEVALYNAGFAAGKPDLEAIRKGRQDDGPLPASAPALTLWVDIFGVEAGDRLQFRITGPDGQPVLEQEQQVEKRQARRFAFSGKRRQAAGWPSGAYTGVVTLTRQVDGKESTYNLTRTATVK